MQIGELSRRTGCRVETIRYYERVGLIPKPERRGSYRCYTPNDVSRLGFIRRARVLGFALDEISSLLVLATGEADSCARAQAIATDHLSEVRARIADLRRMERVLAQAVKACRNGQNLGCPLLDTLAGAPGPFPHLSVGRGAPQGRLAKERAAKGCAVDAPALRPKRGS